jgi:hypothetical protein
MPVEGEGVRKPLVRIACSDGKPKDAFVAVPYRDRWFWIDDRDFASKKLFSFLMFVMTLTSPSEKGNAPVLTLSAGG